MEANIRNIQKQNSPHSRLIEQKVIDSETLSQDDIEKIADQLVDNFLHDDSDRQFTYVVIDLLQPRHIIETMKRNRIGKGGITVADNGTSVLIDGHELTSAEMVSFLRPIRLAVAKRFQERLPNTSVDVTTTRGHLNKNAKTCVFNLESGRILKHPRVYQRSETWKNYERLHEFYNIQPRSRFIAYHHRAFDPGKKADGPAEISEKIKILTNLDDYLFAHEGSSRPVYAAAPLQIFADAMRGELFALQHGFIITDVSLDNIVFDVEKMCGVLYDLDGIYDVGLPVYLYICKLNTHLPPELRRRTGGKKIYNESLVVYEFGVSLRQLCAGLRRLSTDMKIVNEVEKISKRMTREDPQLRITLQQALNQIVDVCPDIGWAEIG